MLRATPPGEDGAPGRGGNGAAFNPPPGEDGLAYPTSQIENEAQATAHGDAIVHENGDDDDSFNQKPTDHQFLEIVSEATSQAQLYSNEQNRASWQRTYRAFLQQHFDGSKYHHKDYANRSRLFIPKTRAAVRKDMAAVAASLFGSIDAINCMAGNEGDAKQRAAAALIQEVVNYRTDRSNTQASLPWFYIAMGARQNSLLTGFCISKQSWKLELQREGTETYTDKATGIEMQRDVWKPFIDRPDSVLIAPENIDIDPAADWTNPAQDSAYLIIKWPTRLDEIRRRQRDPRNPWAQFDVTTLRSGSSSAKTDPASIRRAREGGKDRLDETSTGSDEFGIIWVYETYVRTAGEDWTFFSIEDRHMLTEPKPVREVYPEQMGQRPITFGYGAFEAHRLFPMSPAESWQPLQQESNDIRNLSLDSLKQNIMPVSKVVRGKNVDLEQLRRRGQGSSIMVTNKDDVTWEKVQDLTGSVQQMSQKIDLEFDDLAGVQNYGNIDANNNVGKTLGGLKLAAGAANAVQEFDIRIWIETWVEPTLGQLVRAIQYYESDEIILGICGEKANLFQKYGVNKIDDDLMEQQVTMRVNIGLGSGDPSQRLAKFQSAISVALPLLQLSPAFQKGEKQIDEEAVMSEVFGAAGYRDGGKRFIKEGTPQGPNPQADATTDKLKSEAEKNRALGKKALLDALSEAAKVGLDVKRIALEEAAHDFDRDHKHMEQVGKASDLGFSHAEKVLAIQNVAKGLAPDGSPIDTPEEEAQVAQIKAEQGMGGDTGAAPPPIGEAPPLPAPPPGAGGEQGEAAAPKPKRRTINITQRGPDGRASAFEVMEH